MAVRNPRNLLTLAAACGVAFCVLLVVAYASSGARYFDAKALHGFTDLQGDHVGSLADRLVRFGDPGPVIVLTAGLMALAAARGRLRQAAAIAFLVGATSISSQVLKSVLAYPRHDALVFGDYVHASAFPSGHSTAAMTLAACAVLAAPRAVRPIAAGLGALLALGVGYSVVTLGWHYPSDVVGGFLLATIWTLVVFAALLAAEQRWPQRVGRTRVSAALTGVVDRVAEAGLAVLALAVAVVGATGAVLVGVKRKDDLVDFASGHTAAVAVGLALAASAAVLLAALTAALRRRE